MQASANVEALLGVAAERLLEPAGRRARRRHRRARSRALGGARRPGRARRRCAARLRRRRPAARTSKARCTASPATCCWSRSSRSAPAGAASRPSTSRVAAAASTCSAPRCSASATPSAIGTLADGVVRSFRDMLGYDRVMVYKFDPDGHGKIIAEARDPRLESLLGHHYPASDIPQRARELYLRNRLRVLVDVHYEPAPLRAAAAARQRRRARHVDVLPAQHVAAAPAVPEEHGRHRHAGGLAGARGPALGPDRLPPLLARATCASRCAAAADLLAEVVSTRIAAIENYAHAQVAIQVRRLEQRLVEATSTEGDWRLALFRNPRTLLQPLEATGAALFHDGELLTAGEVPSTRRAARAAAVDRDAADVDGLFSCSSVARANPALDSLTPTASGVLAVKLSAVAARLPDVVPQGAAADGDLGRRPVQAGRRQRPAGAVAAPLVRRLVGDRARHRPALDRQRARAGARLRRRADRHHRPDQRGAAADRRAPAGADPAHGRQLEASRW